MAEPRVFNLTKRSLGNKGMLRADEITLFREEHLFLQYYFVKILISSMILSIKLTNLPIFIVQIAWENKLRRRRHWRLKHEFISKVFQTYSRTTWDLQISSPFLNKSRLFWEGLPFAKPFFLNGKTSYKWLIVIWWSVTYKQNLTKQFVEQLKDNHHIA